MRNSALRLAVASLAATMLAVALPTTSAQEETETTEDERVLDPVSVTAVQNDAAMAAFQAGDFETAEVEFLDNAMCALRRERNLLAVGTNARIGADRAQSLANSNASDTGAGTRGVTAVTQANSGAQQSITDGSSGSTQTAETRRDRTCEQRGRQLYFAGLSQIQLGKTDQALRSFEKATVASKVLYDAHYKIGLIKLLSGDERAARRQLKKVEGILKRCRDCEAKQEIVDRRDHLAKALSGEIALR